MSAAWTPSTHSIMSFGGCGALFTPDIATTLGMTRVLVPELSSVLSAFGAATADIRRERARSLAVVIPGDVEGLEKVASELRDGVIADLEADGLGPAERTVSFEADLRFRRQVWELTIPSPGTAWMARRWPGCSSASAPTTPAATAPVR